MDHFVLDDPKHRIRLGILAALVTTTKLPQGRPLWLTALAKGSDRLALNKLFVSWVHRPRSHQKEVERERDGIDGATSLSGQTRLILESVLCPKYGCLRHKEAMHRHA